MGTHRSCRRTESRCRHLAALASVLPGTIALVSQQAGIEDRPVARVALDVSLTHLDRYFDYAVPEMLSQQAVPGVRVRVQFAGRQVGGFIVDRVAESEHRLSPLTKVVSSLPVLTPATLRLARSVADRYAGTLADVLRAAIPPRHARAEAAVLASPAGGDRDGDRGQPSPGTWGDYTGGAALVRRSVRGEPVRAVWDVGPGEDWSQNMAALAAQAHHHGRGMIAVVPDARDVHRAQDAVTRAIGRDSFEVLTADAGPQRRYSAFVRLITGRTSIAIGTRAACFAPVPDDSLLWILDDGEETYAEPHAPGWHAREVLALRSHLFATPLIAAGATRSVVAQSWIDSGWAAPVSMPRDLIRQRSPRVHPLDEGDNSERVPERAWTVARNGLKDGPVLLQVARRGYVPATACQRCRSVARCTACAGPLTLAGPGAVATCSWCHAPAPSWRCPECGDTRLRATARGSTRTAEELGRAFPQVPVIASGGDRIVTEVPGTPALVVATPGAEPWVEDGYTAVILLDAERMLSRGALGAEEETLRRWFTAASLARPGAPLVVTAQASLAAVQALVRWDPGWFAARDLAQRVELGLPPARRSATVSGPVGAVTSVREFLPDEVEVFGPTSVGADRTRVLLLVDRDHAGVMTEALKQAMSVLSARREAAGVEVRVDPVDWGGELGHLD